MSGKIRKFLSKKAQAYYEQVSEELDTDKNKVTDADILNYVFETLSDTEKIIGDPATFIQDIVTGKKRIIHVLVKPVMEQSDENENHD